MSNPSARQIGKWASKPMAFIDALQWPTPDGLRPFGKVMQGFQRQAFRAILPALLSVTNWQRPGNRFHWWERTKKASKDSDAAALILWALLFSQRPLDIIVAAGDVGQAAEVRKRIRNIVRANRWLERLIKIDNYQVSNPGTGSVCSIITSDTRTTPGQLPDLVVANELTCMEEGFYEELYDNLLGNAGGVLLVCTNAGRLGSWQHTKRQSAMRSDLWSVQVYDRPAPWMNPKELEERRQEERSRLRYERLWLGKWSSGSEGALTAEMIENAICLKGPAECADEGDDYIIAVDLSYAHDRAAAVVLKEQRKLLTQEQYRGLLKQGYEPEELKPDLKKFHVAAKRSWKPLPGQPLELRKIKRHVQDLAWKFDAQRVVIDVWQARLMAEELRAVHVNAETFDPNVKTNQQLATNLRDCFEFGEIGLYDDPELLDDLRSLEFVETPRSYALKAARDRSGHADTGFALAMGIWSLRERSIPRWETIRL